MTKKPYKSITLWVNFLILALSMFDAQFFHLFNLTPGQVAIVMAIVVKVVAVLNLVLRVFFTDSAITLKKQQP